jgi:hypothetical protein
MSSASIGVLPLGTHIIFFLLPMTLLACRVILLNDVETSSFNLAFGSVGLLADTVWDNPFSSSFPLILPLELLLADCCCFLSFTNIGFHHVYSDSNSHLNWPFVSHGKPFLVFCGQLELGKPEPPDSQTGLFILAAPGFSLHSTDSLDRSGLFYDALNYQMYLAHALLILGKMTHIVSAEHTNQTTENKDETS